MKLVETTGNITNKYVKFDYEKYGIYIPLIYQTSKVLSEFSYMWDENNRKDNCVKYITSLLRNKFDFDNFKVDFSKTPHELSMLIQWLDMNRENAEIGKYTIKRQFGFFGFEDDYHGDAITNVSEVYYGCELIYTVSNGGYRQCIEEIIRHAGGSEPWRMLS